MNADVTGALVALTFASLFQPSISRAYAAIIFTAFTLFHEFFLSHTTGLLYYGSAALFDIIIAYFISRLTPIPATVKPLIKICILSALINAIGWFIYLAYLPPVAYDMAMEMVFVTAIFVFIYRGGDDVGIDTTRGGWFSIFSPFSSGRNDLFKSEGKV